MVFGHALRGFRSCVEQSGWLGAWTVSLMNSEIEAVTNTPGNTEPRINAPITFCRFSVTFSRSWFVVAVLLPELVPAWTVVGREDRVFDSTDVMSTRARFDYY